MASRTLLVYYSMTGITRTVAEEVATQLGAEIEAIREPRPRRGLGGVLRALADIAFRREPPIDPLRHRVEAYELVILGGPVWGGRMAAPLRSFARRERDAMRQVAFLCTEGGRGHEKAFGDLQAVCGKAPLAILVVDAAHRAPAAHAEALQRFVGVLRRFDPGSAAT